MADSAARIDFDEGAAPASPAAAQVRLYAKADGLLYSKDDAGAETLVSGGAGAASAFRGARAQRSATQTIPDATWTDVSFTAADAFDTNGLHDPAGANPERITLDKVGYWLVSLNVGWAGNATGGRYIAIAPNGTRIMHVQQAAATATNLYMNTQEIVQATAITDYVEAHVYQDSTGNLNVAAAHMSVAFLGT